MRRLLLTSTALVALSVPAAADPLFTPVILAALGGSAGIFGGATTLVASITSALLVAGIGIALTMLFAPKPSKPENGSVAVQQPLPFRIWGVGTDKVPGAIVFKEENAGYLGVIAALNGHQVSGFRALYLNDDLVTVPITSGFLSGPVAAGADGRYGSTSIAISTKKGSVPESAHSPIVSHFSTLWNSTCRGDGVASLAMLCSPVKSKYFQSNYPYGAPQPAAVVDQAVVFDPRDVTQDPSNPSTWKFSDNPVLCLLWFRCFSVYGSQRPYASAVLPTLSRWIAAATVCDEQAALKAGGAETRYRVGGWMTTEQDRRTGEAAIRAAFDGWTCDRGDGSIDIEAGRFYTPDVTLTDDDILAWTGQRGQATKDRVNRWTAKYKSPGNSYAMVETDPVDDIADQAVRAGPPRALQLDLGWVPSTGQASRLLKRQTVRDKAVSRGTLTLGLSGLNACYARRVRIQSNSIPRLSSVVVEISRPVISLMAGTVTVNYIQVGSEIDSYTPSTDESAPPPSPQRPPTVGLPIPANVAVVAELDPSGGSTVYLNVAWDMPLNNGSPWTSLSYLVEYRVHSAPGGQPGPWTQQAYSDPTVSTDNTRVSIATGAVPTGSLLDVRVSSAGTGNSLSTASTIVQVNTALSAVSPAEPSSLSTAGGVGYVTLTAGNPRSVNFASVQFYRATTGTGFTSSTAIGSPVAGSPGGTSTYTDVVFPGTYDYFATAISTGGTASAPIGPITGSSA